MRHVCIWGRGRSTPLLAGGDDVLKGNSDILNTDSISLKSINFGKKRGLDMLSKLPRDGHVPISIMQNSWSMRLHTCELQLFHITLLSNHNSAAAALVGSLRLITTLFSFQLEAEQPQSQKPLGILILSVTASLPCKQKHEFLCSFPGSLCLPCPLFLKQRRDKCVGSALYVLAGVQQNVISLKNCKYDNKGNIG